MIEKIKILIEKYRLWSEKNPVKNVFALSFILGFIVGAVIC